MLRAAGKPVIVAVNKVDDQMSEYMAAEFWKLGLGEPYPISAMHGRGVGDLLDAAMSALKSAERTSGFLTPSHLRRVALVGRPNVGKSSLLNQLAHAQRSVVNDLAGTTRDPVDEIVDIDGEDYLFIDTAGIKRRQHKLSGAEYYSSLRTQAAIERAELALVLFDASQPISDQDLKVMSSAVDAGRAVVLVFNKWDLMDEEQTREDCLMSVERRLDFAPWAPKLRISALTGRSVSKIWAMVDRVRTNRATVIPTAKLNDLLQQLRETGHTVSKDRKRLRVLYGTQTGEKPPVFTFFCNAPELAEDNYRRYLENRLRETFDLEGTPVRLRFRRKDA